MIEIEGKELGIEGCTFVARGETAGEVLAQVVKHLRAEHHVDMPDADEILEGEIDEDRMEALDPEIALLVERLTDALDIVPAEEPKEPRASIGRTTSA